MKIVSLIPSATEIVFTLGLGDSLEGVTFECDYPPEARTKTIVSGTALPVEEPLTAREIDDAVTARVASGEAIYTLDAPRIRDIQPDVILAQDLCRVSAVPSGAVEEALDVIGWRAEVVSLDPMTLDDVIACIASVGDATGTAVPAAALCLGLHARLTAVRNAVVRHHRPRTLTLEWSDPPFSGGHWVPDMIESAGGDPVLARAGERSRRIEWDGSRRPTRRSRCSCRAGTTSNARSRRVVHCSTSRRSPGAIACSSWTRTRCSRGPARGWSTASRRWRGCCIRGRSRRPHRARSSSSAEGYRHGRLTKAGGEHDDHAVPTTQRYTTNGKKEWVWR